MESSPPTSERVVVALTAIQQAPLADMPTGRVADVVERIVRRGVHSPSTIDVAAFQSAI